MARTPNVPTIVDDTRPLQAAVNALDQVERDKRAAATGAAPSAVQQMRETHAGKMAAADRVPIDDGRNSDQPVRRLDRAASAPVGAGGNANNPSA